MEKFNFNGLSDVDTGQAVIQMMLEHGSQAQLADLMKAQVKKVIEAKGDIQKSIDIVRDADNNIVSAKHVEKTDLETCTMQLTSMILELVRVVKSGPEQGSQGQIDMLLAERELVDKVRKVEKHQAEKLQKTIDLLMAERSLLAAQVL